MDTEDQSFKAPLMRGFFMALFFVALCPWVGFVVGFCQLLVIQVGVNLRGAQVAVAEHFLHCTQVARRFQHMAGKRMA